MAWRQLAYNYLKAAAALRASSREQLAVYMRVAAESDSATAYKRVLDDAGEVRLCSVLTLSGDAMAPAFLPGDRVRGVTLPVFWSLWQPFHFLSQAHFSRLFFCERCRVSLAGG